MTGAFGSDQGSNIILQPKPSHDPNDPLVRLGFREGKETLLIDNRIGPHGASTSIFPWFPTM